MRQTLPSILPLSVSKNLTTDTLAIGIDKEIRATLVAEAAAAGPASVLWAMLKSALS